MVTTCSQSENDEEQATGGLGESGIAINQEEGAIEEDLILMTRL